MADDAEFAAHYRVGREIGRGAFGVVSVALDVRTGASVAVKKSMLSARSSPDDVEALVREVETLSRLASPHILRYIASFRTASCVWLITELVEGGSLASLIARHGPLPETLASFWIAQALCGLDYLHGEGLLHRDVKAANFLVDKGGVLKLADFGLVIEGAKAEVPRLPSALPSSARAPLASARSVGSESQSERGAASARAGGGVTGVAGSAHWWSPEVIEMAVPSAAADVWAIGATVVELVTGRPPCVAPRRCAEGEPHTLACSDSPPRPSPPLQVRRAQRARRVLPHRRRRRRAAAARRRLARALRLPRSVLYARARSAADGARAARAPVD